MDYKLSDFTLMGWIFIVTTAVVLIGGGILLRAWLAQIAPPRAPITNTMLALPGLVYMAVFWWICKSKGIKLVKDR